MTEQEKKTITNTCTASLNLNEFEKGYLRGTIDALTAKHGHEKGATCTPQQH